jgi:CRP/FNR family transcriptional regulator, cyclic AMP receptor protein
MRSLQQFLDAAPWMGSLDAVQQARVSADILVRDFDANAVVCRKNEEVLYWVGVIDGLVKISSVSLEGKPVSFTGVPTGGWLGEGSLLKDEPRRYDVIALRETRIAFMPKSTFNALLDSGIAFNRFLLEQINERLGQFIGTVEFDRLLGPNARLARCVAQLFNPLLYPGQGNRLEISQVELGYLTGLSRQRTNQALQVLQDAGLLKVDYGSIDVLDLEALRSFEAG